MFVSIRIISVLKYLTIFAMDNWNVVNQTSRSPSISSQELSLSDDDSDTEHCLTINITGSEQNLDKELSEILKDNQDTLQQNAEPPTDQGGCFHDKLEISDKGKNSVSEEIPLVQENQNDSAKDSEKKGFFTRLKNYKIKNSGWLLIGITAFFIFSKLSSS